MVRCWLSYLLLTRRWWYAVDFLMSMLTRCWCYAVDFLMCMLIGSWLHWCVARTPLLQPRCIESQVSNKFWLPFVCAERNVPLALSECQLVTPSKLRAFRGSREMMKKCPACVPAGQVFEKNTKVKILTSTKTHSFLPFRATARHKVARNYIYIQL